MLRHVWALILTLCLTVSASADPVKVGLNYPKTGPYSVQGLDQWRATELAIEEINASGGILGRPVELVWRDSQSKADVTVANVTELIDTEGVSMVFGGSSSGVAVAAGGVCQEKSVPFFGTLTYSTATEAHRFTFRECNDSWAAAKVLADYMNREFAGKTYLYITADYTWGHTTERSFRTLTGTEDESAHRGILTPFPGATDADFGKAVAFAKMTKPDVLVLVLFGNDMARAIRQVTAQGLKSQMEIVVPNLTLGMAEGGGPKVMAGVVGTLPWCWQVPYQYGYEDGKAFVERFAAAYDRYPSTSGASAYTILHEYKAAVERAGSFDGADVVRALEGHRYTRLKDEQEWRDFDHQSVQTVYAVRCKPEVDVLRDRFKLDYFEILASMPGDDAFVTRDEWVRIREAAGKPPHLEPLPGEPQSAER